MTMGAPEAKDSVIESVMAGFTFSGEGCLLL
jgi:hypothetical protein